MGMGFGEVLRLLRCLAMVATVVAVTACGAAARGPSAAVVTVCRAALEASNSSQVEFVRAKTVTDAESSAGSIFAAAVAKWLAGQAPGARTLAASAVVRDCNRIDGFPRS